MGDSSHDEMITLKQSFGHISDEESIRIANEIDSALLPFFNKEVVQDKDTNVIAVERKGLNLFHPYLNSIKGMRTIISIKPLNHAPYKMEYHFHSVLDLDRSYILLTDAISTGTEARTILNLSIFKIKALGGYKKVCGYIALKKTLDELQKEYPEIEFRFLRIIEDLDEYYETHKKIIYVYQKRMEPIDEEHEFFVVDIRPELSVTELKSHLINIITQRFGDCAELRDNELGICTRFNFTAYFNDPEQFMDAAFNIRLLKDDVLDKLAIRFKYSTDDAKLRVMVLSMPHLNCESRIQFLRRRLLGSCARNVPKNHCKLPPYWARLSLPMNRSKLCATCVDTNISKSLLDEIYSLISKSGLLKVK